MLLNTGADIVKGKLLLGHRHVTTTQTQDKRRRMQWVGTFPRVPSFPGPISSPRTDSRRESSGRFGGSQLCKAPRCGHRRQRLPRRLAPLRRQSREGLPHSSTGHGLTRRTPASTAPGRTLIVQWASSVLTPSGAPPSCTWIALAQDAINWSYLQELCFGILQAAASHRYHRYKPSPRPPRPAAANCSSDILLIRSKTIARHAAAPIPLRLVSPRPDRREHALDWVGRPDVHPVPRYLSTVVNTPLANLNQTSVVLTPGMRTHLGNDWYVLAGIPIPLTSQ